MHHLS
jgi:hypothetical protein